jgi:hypothetical protein
MGDRRIAPAPCLRLGHLVIGAYLGFGAWCLEFYPPGVSYAKKGFDESNPYIWDCFSFESRITNYEYWGVSFLEKLTNLNIGDT